VDERHYGGGKTYGQETIRRAIANTTETYSPARQKRIIQEESGSASSEDTKTILPFPDVMSGLAGEFAKVYAQSLEVPEQFFFMGFLTCLGSLLADKATLATEIKPQPRLYVVLLGESAEDRKSTGITKVVDFFKDALLDGLARASG